MKSKHFSFKSKEGEKVVDGKVSYPHYLDIELAEWQALDVIEILASQLRDSEREGCRILLWGKLELALDEGENNEEITSNIYQRDNNS